MGPVPRPILGVHNETSALQKTNDIPRYRPTGVKRFVRNLNVKEVHDLKNFIGTLKYLHLSPLGIYPQEPNSPHAQQVGDGIKFQCRDHQVRTRLKLNFRVVFEVQSRF